MSRRKQHWLVGIVWTIALAINVPVLLSHSDAAQAARGRAAARTQRAVTRAISISWVGDMTLGSRYGLPPDGGRALFGDLRTRLRRSDLTIGNLEGTFSVGGASKCAVEGGACFSFQAPPANARALRAAGFDLVNLANNHAFDFGAEGQRQTIDALDAAGVGHAGLPGQVTTLERGGARIAVVGFAPYPWSNDPRDLAVVATTIAAAKRSADLVVVLAHLGSEGSDQGHVPVGVEMLGGEDRGDTRAFAHAAVDAGADVVLGSGPHVLRGIERYRGKAIAYSLGNFAGWHNFATSGTLSSSGILTVRLSPKGGWRGGRFTSVALDAAGAPARDGDGTAALMVNELGAADFPGAAVTVASDGRLEVPAG